MSQFGVQPFGGEAGVFGGPGLLTILNVVPIAANEAIVFFDEYPKVGSPLAFDAVTNLRNWTLSAVDPTIPSTDIAGLVFIPRGEVVPTVFPQIVRTKVDVDDETQVHLFTDSKMESRVRYDVEINPLVRGDQCQTFAGPTTWRFRALQPGPRRQARFVQEDRYRDWDNSFFPSDAKQPEATWRLGPDGDIALHSEDEALRKRILRRILAAPGDYPHLGPGYGAGIRVKAMARTGAMQNMANTIADQVRREPDVQAAAVTAQLRSDVANEQIVQVEVFVQRREQRDARFLFEFPTA